VLLQHSSNTNTPEVVQWCDRGLAVLDKADLGGGQKESARLLRHDLFHTRAGARVREERYLEALGDLEAAFRCDPKRKAPYVAGLYAAITGKARYHLVVELMRRGRHAEAVAYADALAALPSVPGEALYDGACACGVAAVAEKDAALRDKYAARAVALLRRAFATGFGKDPIQKASGLFGDPVEHMQRDPDLAAVRGRDDYRQLLADLRRQP
jgi:hypothetical protein